MVEVVVLIFGLLIGSFLNVVIYRLPKGESVVWPGSYCTACGQGLKAGDLVPVFSYLFLRGKCRFCGEKISLRYPLVELLNGIAFLLVYMQFGLSIWTVSGMILTAILIVSLFIDIDEGIIPDIVTYPAIIVGLILANFTVGTAPALTGALLFGGILFTAALISRGGMGGGDVKLALAIGAFCGLQNAFMAFILASLSGGIWAAVLLLSRQAGRKTAIKFGPFLAVGGYTAFVYGQELIVGYLRMLGM